jgi:hypothetical protein
MSSRALMRSQRNPTARGGHLALRSGVLRSCGSSPGAGVLLGGKVTVVAGEDISISVSGLQPTRASPDLREISIRLEPSRWIGTRCLQCHRRVGTQAQREADQPTSRHRATPASPRARKSVPQVPLVDERPSQLVLRAGCP